MLKSWFEAQSEHQYWLVDHKLHKLALAQNGGFGFEEAVPLFYGSMFDSVMPLSPWLIPVTDIVLELPESLLAQGLVLSSQVSTQEVLGHLRSLLIAALDGEEVMFRFYDRDVIIPILRAMDESEVNHFLGNINQLVAIDHHEEDALITFSNTSCSEFVLRHGTWWNMLPHHLAPLYNVNVHANSLERRWWELLPHLLQRLESPQQTILSALQSALEKQNSYEVAEQHALVALVTVTDTALDDLSHPLHLTLDELKELKAIKESWQ
ncbi:MULTISPECIES: DUF4123 domain-containing protein [unclassified Vibrio]|uniref:DUF4123 domain-containing protein n=1 Tax=unclassified Vibrio TaxID=2614977 RepID=UPI000B8E6945|nr:MULTISPECIES: DUF4123 domain-containing protein [unclassified Vibrio]NAX43114.1 DUF4123 domain-containing protein [Vibrio sp. V25_P4S6T154]